MVKCILHHAGTHLAEGESKSKWPPIAGNTAYRTNTTQHTALCACVCVFGCACACAFMWTCVRCVGRHKGLGVKGRQKFVLQKQLAGGQFCGVEREAIEKCHGANCPCFVAEFHGELFRKKKKKSLSQHMQNKRVHY